MSINIDVAQLVQKIRAEVDQRSERPIIPMLPASSRNATPGIPPALTSGLHSLDGELEALQGQLQTGEPLPPSPTVSNRLGSLIKHRLYRFLWWQSDQIRTLVILTVRRGREELKLVDALSESIGRLSQEVRQTQDLALESNRKLRECESRLQQLESAQLRLQAGQIKQSVDLSSAQWEDKFDSVRREVSEAKQFLDGAEARIIQQVASENAATMQRIQAVAQRSDVEVAQYEQLDARLSELNQRVETQESQGEQLGARLSDLGIFTHQTRSALSMQDRRTSLFIEEARKRLPAPFNETQLRGLVKNHDNHKYDSIYRAFEDVFRGSRDEIKSRQNVYVPFLKDRNIGSNTMPILDLGCGRGEWLELLNEHGLEGRGVDVNESMVEQCKSLGLQVDNGEALSHLRGLPDSSVGALTSFHMVEHLPFELTLTLVDEALRVLKPGGILILETPNPQNILVGAHTFHLDPSHLKPLPSPMLRFFVEARGFCDAHVWELQPYPESVRLPDNGNAIAKRLNDHFYGPQDYAVIGRKP